MSQGIPLNPDDPPLGHLVCTKGMFENKIHLRPGQARHSPPGQARPGQARPGQARRGADPRRMKASLATKPRLTIRNLSGIYPDSNDYLYQGQGLGPWPGLELWAGLAFLAKKDGPALVSLIEKRETRLCLCDTNITHSI